MFDPTPISVSSSTDMAVPAEFAFDVLADPSSARVIDPAIREYRPDQVPMALGTRTTIKMRMWGIPMRAASLVVAWEPGRIMVMQGTKPTRPVRVTARHMFAPSRGPDSCRYTWEIDIEPVGRLGRVVAPFVARALAGNARAPGPRFKTEAERRWRRRPDT